ncbi:MAG: Spo0E-like regulatory phosphatase [Paenibacillaceae bacterium]|jgi:hypothetical protein|nr:Spo0E-like regulatory phosphatase [Paenibacillaceae bacterium]
MLFADYACRSYKRSIMIRDSGRLKKWTRPLSSKPLLSAALEDEIYVLRRNMEQLASREQSLSAPGVVELSRRLDHVLNEYMNEQPRT